MRFVEPLIPGRLIRRYKRFLADVELTDGAVVTAHCANPGAMTGLADPGATVWLEPNDDPKRKLNYSWKLVELAEGWAGIDTSVPNKVVGEALRAGAIPAFAAYEAIRAEVAYATRHRVDFLATARDLPDAYIEVKNCHLRRDAGAGAGLAEFPDSVTTRGAKHMAALAEMARAGARAAVIWLVQRDDCDRFALADDIDAAYAAATRAAAAAGVETYSFRAVIDRTGVRLGDEIEISAL